MPRDGTATRERILDAAQDLVLHIGFSATSVDAVLAAAPATKGAFFHHFPSKNALGRALLERYAAEDAQALDEFMAAAEAETDDPAEQVVAFLRRFEEAAGELPHVQPGCLFVSLMYEQEIISEGSEDLIARAVTLWSDRFLEKLEAAVQLHPPAIPVDLRSLAELGFTTFEGGFILTRVMKDPTRLRTQLTHLRQYLELLFGLTEPASA